MLTWSIGIDLSSPDYSKTDQAHAHQVPPARTLSSKYDMATHEKTEALKRVTRNKSTSEKKEVEGAAKVAADLWKKTPNAPDAATLTMYKQHIKAWAPEIVRLPGYETLTDRQQ